MLQPRGRVTSILLGTLIAFSAPLKGAIDAPVSPDALPEVASLMEFMNGLTGRMMLSGQFELPEWDGDVAKQETEFDFLFAKTGRYPALRGFDFMRWSQGSDAQRYQRDAERAIEWHKRGGVVTYCYHAAMPAIDGGRDFYPTGHYPSGGKGTNFDAAKAVIEGTDEYREMIRVIDFAAEELKKLQDARVPVLWRPYHECSGGWFWWGTKGPGVFKDLWRIMFTRYTKVHGLRNLIWVYNPAEASGLEAWYPGDEYVDMVSLDTYDNGNPNRAADSRTFHAFRNGRKVVWLSENGRLPDPDRLVEDDVKWTAFATWYRDFITTPSRSGNTEAVIKSVFQHERVITLDEVSALWATKPVFRITPEGGQARPGSKVVLSALALASGPISYQWHKDGLPIPGASAADLILDSVSEADSGVYMLKATTAGGGTMTPGALLEVGGEPHAPPAAYLFNLSARAKAGKGDDVLIVGFAIRGPGSKKVLIRAVGPTLGLPPFSIQSVLPDSDLTLYEKQTMLATNNHWHIGDKAAMEAAFSPVAFPLPPKSWDSALVVQLPEGEYSAVARGRLGTTGIAIIEVYDLDPEASTRLINLSTRAWAGVGGEQVFAGFSVRGHGALKVLTRAIGPTLAKFDVAGSLIDPKILVQIPGEPPAYVADNDDWSQAGNANEIVVATPAAGAFPLDPRTKDSVLLNLLPSGNYTATISGKGGATGVTLVEVYRAD